MAPPWRDRGREPRGCASTRHSTYRCASTPHSICRCAGTRHSTRPATAGTVRGRGRHTPAPWAPDGHTGPPLAQQQKAWGIAGDTRAVARTITLRMTDDMRFTPRHIEVREGETVRLRARNEGQALHEIVLGTKADLAAHAALMSQPPGMQHDGPSMAHVQAGQQRDIVWTFNRPGQFDFACLVAGHYQSGMTGTITVLPRKQ